jgi:hypothetical protein
LTAALLQSEPSVASRIFILRSYLKVFNLPSPASMSKICSHLWRRERRRFYRVFTVVCAWRMYLLSKYPQWAPKCAGHFPQRSFTSLEPDVPG